MTRGKRTLFLIVASCLALFLALCIKWAHQPRTPGREAKPDELCYSINHKFHDASGVVQFDRSIQFTFAGDSTISPGSLVQMTGQMHNSEIEIATRLAKDIKFSR